MGLDHGIKVIDKLSGGDVSASFVFRKFNALQGYFENKYNIENCETIEISMEDIKLLNLCCVKILAERDTTVSEEMLPTYQGFFFGSYDYDDWYYEDVEQLLKVTNAIVKLYHTTNFLITYWCWY